MTSLFTKRSGRIAALSAVAAGALVATTVVPAVAAEEADPFVLGDDGTTSVAYDYDAAIKESVWVDAPDLDGDGERERIAVDVIRPAELDGAAEVPVIMDASPYYSTSGRGNESEHKTYDEDGVIESFPLFYDNYFVPRGYAYVAVDMAGTSRSTGCVDQGGASDIVSAKAAVDWLNGNATATYADGSPAVADWSNGKTGMIGKSYDGTLANGVASMAPEGLETIVPISAISSWYDYDRAQNIPYSYGYPRWLSSYVGGNRTMPQDCTEIWDQMDIDAADDTGLYTDWWAERDYREGTLGDASQIEASVFIMHGLQDTNVDMHNVSRLWEKLVEHDVDRKMLLTRLGHVDAFDSDREMWVDTLHRWFDQELMGIDNGISDDPAVQVEVQPNTWTTSDEWPIVDRVAQLRPKADGSLSLGKGGRQGDAGWTNDPNGRFATALAEGDDPSRLLFTTGTLRDDLRLSGTASVTTTVTTSADVGQITVGLVDYGTADRVLTQNDGARTLDTESCWGESSDVDDACYFDVERMIGSTDYQVLGRGWARLEAGTQTLTVEMLPNDIVVPEGHQLGLVVMGVDRGATVTLDQAASDYAIDLGATTLNLPVTGPMSSFAPGQSKVPSVDELDDDIVSNDTRLLPL